MAKMTPFLWFEGNVAEAMDFYRSVFPESNVVGTMPGPNGTLMGATFELDGQRFIAFAGGPHLKRAMNAMLGMKKSVIAAVGRAAAGA